MAIMMMVRLTEINKYKNIRYILNEKLVLFENLTQGKGGFGFIGGGGVIKNRQKWATKAVEILDKI